MAEKAAKPDFFLKIDGIPGESFDSKHKNEIEILSFSFGADNTGSFSEGSGGGSGKVSLQDFHFVKKWDKASSNLFKRCANGEHIASAVLSCRKPTGEGGQQDYLIIKFSNLLISHYSCGGSGGGNPIPLENIAINFTKIEFDYKPQKTEGGALGGSVLAGWDTKENVAT